MAETSTPSPLGMRMTEKPFLVRQAVTKSGMRQEKL